MDLKVGDKIVVGYKIHPRNNQFVEICNIDEKIGEIVVKILTIENDGTIAVAIDQAVRDQTKPMNVNSKYTVKLDNYWAVYVNQVIRKIGDKEKCNKCRDNTTKIAFV